MRERHLRAKGSGPKYREPEGPRRPGYRDLKRRYTADCALMLAPARGFMAAHEGPFHVFVELTASAGAGRPRDVDSGAFALKCALDALGVDGPARISAAGVWFSGERDTRLFVEDGETCAIRRFPLPSIPATLNQALEGMYRDGYRYAARRFSR